MKRPRREGGGGEVALMAVITKAMGAFLVLVVIMLPDYVYVVQNGKQGASAQQALADASQEAKQLEQALNAADVTPQGLTAMRQNLQDLEQKLAALKDEVASLSDKLGQADAEIGRLTAIDVAENAKQDSSAQQALADVSQEAKQLEQALNAADVTPQGLTAMRQNLQDLEQKLAALKDEVSSLSGQLRQADVAIERLKKLNEDLKAQADALKVEVASLTGKLGQALAEIEPLKKENESLKAQAEDLKDQIEKLKAEAVTLKNRPLAATVATLSWSGCYGADIELFVQGKVGDADKPPIDRKSRVAVQYTGDRIGQFQVDFATDAGSDWWTLTDIEAYQRFTLWAKIVNPVNTAKSKPRSCELWWTITTSRGEGKAVGGQISDAYPIRLLEVDDLNAKSELNADFWDKLTVAEIETMRGLPFKQPCDGMLCPFDEFNSAPRPDSEIRPKFIEYVTGEYDAEDVASRVFDLMASGAMSVDDGYRWLGLFPRVDGQKGETAKPDDIAALRRALDEKGVPAFFSDALMKRVADGLRPPSRLVALLQTMPAFGGPSAASSPSPTGSPSPGHEPSPAPTSSPSATNDILEDLVAKSVAEGALTQAQSGAILAAKNHSLKPSDAEIDKRLEDARLPTAVAELLKKLIKSGDFDLNALPTATPRPRRSSMHQ